jgi:hypothetical protein
MPIKKSKFGLKLNRKLLIVLIFGLSFAGLLYFFKDQFIVAWVNGQPISRQAYVAELTKLAKNQALDSLLTKQQIKQEASRQKVSVANEEIDAAIKNIEARASEQGTSLEELLTVQDISMANLREEIRLQKLLEKMVGEITIPEDKIQSYYDSNKEMFFGDKTVDEAREEIETQLRQQELINKIQELIARLRNEAKIVKWLN